MLRGTPLARVLFSTLPLEILSSSAGGTWFYFFSLYAAVGIVPLAPPQRKPGAGLSETTVIGPSGAQQIAFCRF